MEIYEARLILNYDNKAENDLVMWFKFEKDDRNDWIYQETRYYW